MRLWISSVHIGLMTKRWTMRRQSDTHCNLIGLAINIDKPKSNSINRTLKRFEYENINRGFFFSLRICNWHLEQMYEDWPSKCETSVQRNSSVSEQCIAYMQILALSLSLHLYVSIPQHTSFAWIILYRLRKPSPQYNRNCARAYRYMYISYACLCIYANLSICVNEAFVCGDHESLFYYP